MSAVNAPSGPQSALPTAAEFVVRPEYEYAELVAGVVEFPPRLGFEHGVLCSRIGRLIGNHVDATDLGTVASNDTWVHTRFNPDTLRGADLCYVSYDRLPKGELPVGQRVTPPDLVVEVRSPPILWSHLLIKTSEYFRMGVRAVVVLDLPANAAAVYRDNAPPQLFHAGDTLTLPDVLPGFAAPVSRLFA